MKIGIDIDEVVVECAKHFLTIHKDKTGVDFACDSLFSYNLWEPVNITKEEALKYFEEFGERGVYTNPVLISFAREAIDALFVGNKIIFITSRPEKVRKETEALLTKIFKGRDFGVFYSGDFHKGGNKLKSEICLENNCSFLLEDQASIAEDCAKKGIKVILFDKPWNQKGGSHKNIYRVSDWKGVLDKMGEIKDVN